MGRENKGTCSDGSQAGRGFFLVDEVRAAVLALYTVCDRRVTPSNASSTFFRIYSLSIASAFVFPSLENSALTRSLE